MKKIKAIMCDLDGTLLCEKGYVLPETIDAIVKIREKGILFGIATGRDILTCENLYKEWGIDGLVDMIIGINGAHIKDYHLHIVEQQYPLEGHVIKEIIKLFDDMDVNFCISQNGFIMMPKDDAIARHLSKTVKIPLKVVDYDKFLESSHPKLLIVCEENKMQAVIKRAEAHPDSRLISMNTSPILYEYMDYRVSKANGLKNIMNKHGWTMDQLMVFGDARNDIEMVRDSGVGICMINGCDEVKAVSDYITEYDNNHEGIAKFLHSYFSL